MLMFLLLVVSTFSTPDQGVYVDFKKWIRQLNISIPMIETKFNGLGLEYNLEIIDLFVTNIDIKSINAPYYPDPETIGTGIKLEAILDADISGRIRIYRPLLDEAGNFSANIKGADFGLAVNFSKGNDGLIEEAIVIQDTCGLVIESITADIKLDSKVLNFLIGLIKDAIVNSLKDSIGSMMCGSIEEELTKMMTDLFTQINNYIRPYMGNTDPINIMVGEDMYDIRKSQLIDMMRFVLTNFTGIYGPLNFNALINKFTAGTGNMSVMSLLNYFGINNSLDFSIPIETLGSEINISLADIGISGLNTWNVADFFEPIGAHKLDTYTGMDKLGINVSFGINVSANSDMITTGNYILHEEGDIDILLLDNKMKLQMQIASKEGAGLDYTNTMCLQPDCIASLMSDEGTGMTFLGFGTSIDHVLLNGTGSLEEDVREVFNNIVQLFVENYKSAIPVFMNGFINGYGVEMVNSYLVDFLSTTNCTYEEDEPYSDIKIIVTVSCFIGAAVITAIILLMVIFIKIKGKNKEQRPMSEKALVVNEKLPLVIRILMVLFIFGNIALFISSNTGIGASVFIKFYIGPKKISLPSMFDFGLINSIIDMWKSKAYALAVLIAVMSCVWPYTKLLLMVSSWLIPGTVLSPARRKRMLEILDALGKWSFVDSFVMILMLVAFYMKIGFPTMSDQVSESMKINLFVYPAYGFVTLMLGTVISLALSHVILALDRFVDEDVEESKDDGTKESLSKRCPKTWQSVVIAVSIVITIVFYCLGITLNSFSFEFVGLAGWALKLLGNSYRQLYSVISLGADISTAAEYPDSFGIRFTQILYFLITIILPGIHLLTLLTAWVVPMKKKVAKAMHVACEILYAWSCLDVFVISIIAAVLEISQLAEFMVGDKCDMIDPIVKDFFSNEDQIRGYEKCFGVVTNMESGLYVLAVAAILHNVVTIVINRVVKNYGCKGDEEQAEDKCSAADQHEDDQIELSEMSKSSSVSSNTTQSSAQAEKNSEKCAEV